jgi:hypothetical protein
MSDGAPDDGCRRDYGNCNNRRAMHDQAGNGQSVVGNASVAFHGSLEAGDLQIVSLVYCFSKRIDSATDLVSVVGLYTDPMSGIHPSLWWSRATLAEAICRCTARSWSFSRR